MKSIAIISLLLCSAACTNKTSDSTSTPTHKLNLDPATAATISGVVKFQGTPQKPQKIDMSADPACGSQPNYDRSLIVTDSNLANVFVYVKELAHDTTDAAPTQPLVITQKGCAYEPHVTVARVGQPVHFINADPTTHNIHMMPAQLKQWNESQMPISPPIEKRFDHSEVMIPIKCNQHPWMHMYLSVVNNDLYAIAGADGRFEIHGLPPGTYTIAAVHERLGEQDMKVTVAPKESKSLEFSFRDTNH
jgi:plastocyanin